MNYSFTRYLAAKRAIDDRSLNHTVWQTLLNHLPPGPLDILEVGAGTGTMIERLLDRGVLAAGGRYTAVDADPANVAVGQRMLAAREWPVAVEWKAADVFDFAQRAQGYYTWDLLIAHAFLDLIDAPRLLPELFALLRPGGLFYFTINFDGLTVLAPTIDPGFDDQVIDLYHRTMDERNIGGQPTGGSRSGRSLLSLLPSCGADVLSAGSSDWVVWPRSGRYPGDEAYFLHHMLHFFESSLTGRPEVDPEQFAVWLAKRRAQVENAELTLIAHQLDLCGTVRGAREKSHRLKIRGHAGG